MLVKEEAKKFEFRKPDFSYEELKSLLEYDPLEGTFRWTNNAFHRVAGKPAGNNCKKDVYAYIMINKNNWLAHRLAWFLYYGYYPTVMIDHRDRNRANNKIDNLKEVTGTENNQNLSLPIDNKSGVCGVHYDIPRQKWKAQIKINGKTINIGRYTNFQDAVDAREEYRKKLGFSETHGKLTEIDKINKEKGIGK